MMRIDERLAMLSRLEKHFSKAGGSASKKN